MKLASIEIIKSIKNHENADSLEIAEVLGWQTIVKKGIHKEGDKVVFITIDTIVPRYTWSAFLADSKNPDKPIRIKNIKLRGEFSSGLVISLNEFDASPFKDYDIGTDLTEIIGITKYIKEIPANLSGETLGDFPTHLASKTDEDNGLNDPKLVEKVLNHDSHITVTSKLDGSSITLIVENGELTQVCTRNLSKKETENNTFWKAARKITIPENWTGNIQGELCGNGIQRNQLKLEDVKIFVFQISENKKYMTYEEMKDFCENSLHCDVVPLVCKLELESTIKLWVNPLQKLQELADKQKYPSGLEGEGIVIRPSSYPKGYSSRRPLGFKLINRNYKD
jgi:RNA ligase (TIGR02306 family)